MKERRQPNEEEKRKIEVAILNLENYLANQDNTSHLHPTQLEALQAILNCLKSRNNKMYVQMPTGTGKSVIIASLVDAFASETNVITSRINLTKQLSQAITDKSKNAECEVITGRNKSTSTVTIGTYNAFRNGSLPNVPITLFDEAHNLHGEETNRVQSATSGILIGFTATPDYEGRLLDKEFGKKCFSLEVEDAIKQGLMSPFDVIKVIVGVGKENLTDKNLVKPINAEVRLNSLISLYEKYFQGKKVVIKTTSIKRAIEIEQKMQEAGLSVIAVHKDTDEEVSDILSRFKNGSFDILIGVKIISEGFDMPDIDGVMFDSTPDSNVEVMQFAGRALRVSTQNPYKRATIIHVDNPNNTEPKTYSALVGINTAQVSTESFSVPSKIYGNGVTGREITETPGEFPQGFERPFAEYEFLSKKELLQGIKLEFNIPDKILEIEFDSFMANYFNTSLVRHNFDDNSKIRCHLTISNAFYKHIREKTTPDTNLLTRTQLFERLDRSESVVRRYIAKIKKNESLRKYIVYKFDSEWRTIILFRPEILNILNVAPKAPERPAEGWLSKDELIRMYSIYIDEIDISDIQINHPEWFKVFSNRIGQNHLFYSVDFATHYRSLYPLLQEVNRSEWYSLYGIDSGELSQYGIKIDRRFFLEIFNILANEDPNLFHFQKDFRAKSGNQTYYNIVVIEKIDAYIKGKSTVPDGYMSQRDMIEAWGVSPTTLHYHIKRLNHEPKYVYNSRNQKVAYFSPVQIEELGRLLKNKSTPNQPQIS